MNFHNPRVDPLRLASATIQAVDRIGEAAAEEINEAADEIVRGADEIAEKLRELAEAIKGHSKVAHEHISTFCDKATSMLDGIRNLQLGIGTLAQDPKASPAPDDIPAFLNGGSAVSSRFQNLDNFCGRAQPSDGNLRCQARQDGGGQP